MPKKPKLWSFNTSVRNPERILDNLKIIRKLEGKKYNKANQAEYFKLLIKNKFYKPNSTPDTLKEEYEYDGEFDDRNTQIIYDAYTGEKDLRGRTTIAPLRKTGLITWEEDKKIKITTLGKSLLGGSISFEEFMLKFCLKWELPNPIEPKFCDFNIKPFIATLKIINGVNHQEKDHDKKEKGISIDEFKQFVIPVKDYNNIKKAIENIIEYRNKIKDSKDKNLFIDETLVNCVCKIFDIDESNEILLKKKLNVLKDYADSAIRYFRITEYIIYRGGGPNKYIDINPNRLEESKEIISKLSSSSSNKQDQNEYINYLENINSPELPWENRENMEKIFYQLNNNIKSIEQKIQNQYPNAQFDSNKLDIDLSTATNEILKIIIKQLQKNVEIITNQFYFIREKNSNNLKDYCKKLQELNKVRPSKSDKKNPVKLEWFTSLSLMSINDAKKIKPNLKIGDDGEPLHTALGEQSDIECYYSNFNLSVEVTMMKNRSQTVAEVQPVMRHLRDLEEQHDEDFYCLFIAPVIHRDTLNQFWFFVKDGYEGKKQNIIPLTLKQYINILNIIIQIREHSKVVTSKNLKFLLENLSQIPHKNYVDSTIWSNKIDKIIKDWKSFLS
jgi:hypothetical protein